MITISMIGNLAADAEVKAGNGKNWLTFRLADTRKWTDANGKQYESTQWASCIMPATQTNLVPYLRKGVKIFVSGSCDIEIYSSPKLRCMVGRYNISVQHVELCGGTADAVPRRLVTPDGIMIDVEKVYRINEEKQKKNKYTELYGERGGVFMVDKKGFLTPQPATVEQQEQSNSNDTNVGDGEPFL